MRITYVVSLLPALLFGGLGFLIYVKTKAGLLSEVWTKSKKITVWSSLAFFGGGMLFFFYSFLSALIWDVVGIEVLPYPVTWWFAYVAVAALLTLTIAVCGLIADVAKSKGRSWGAFFALSLFFPLIMWIVVTVISSDESIRSAGTKNCPRCAEPVRSEASLCKHCGSEI